MINASIWIHTGSCGNDCAEAVNQLRVCVLNGEGAGSLKTITLLVVVCSPTLTPLILSVTRSNQRAWTSFQLGNFSKGGASQEVAS